MPKLYSYDIDDALDFEVVEALLQLLYHHLGESKQMKHLIIGDNTLAVQDCTAYRGTFYPDQDFVSPYVESCQKCPTRDITLRILDHVYYPQTAADLAQICQELAGDYVTSSLCWVLTIG